MIRPTEQDWQRIKKSVLFTERRTMLDAIPKRRKWPFQGSGAAGEFAFYQHWKNRVSTKFADDKRKQFTIGGVFSSDVGIQAGTGLLEFLKTGVFLISFTLTIEAERRGGGYGARQVEFSANRWSSGLAADDRIDQGYAWRTKVTIHDYNHENFNQPFAEDRYFTICPSFIVQRTAGEYLDFGLQRLDELVDRPTLQFGSPSIEVDLSYLNFVKLQ